MNWLADRKIKMEKSYTAAEVYEHKKATDLWLTLDGGVYNMTDFLAQHPGGEEVLLKQAGQDGTACFNEIGHSAEASQLREAYRIGRLEGPPYILSEAKAEERTSDEDLIKAYESKEITTSNHSVFPIFIGLAVLIYGYIFTYVL